MKKTCLLLLGSFSLMTGCALIRSDTPPHTQITPAGIHLPDDIQIPRDSWPAKRWWSRYQDAQLDALIDAALAKSPTMAMVHARTREAHAAENLSKASSGLHIAAVGALNRQRTSGSGFLAPYAHEVPLLGLTGPWYTAGSVGLSGGLHLDIWGKERATLEAAVGAHKAKIAEAAAAELEISSTIAQLYYSIQTSYRLIELLEQSKAVVQLLLSTYEGRAEQGLESKTRTHSARGQLLAIEQQITSTRGQIQQTREALRALVGAGAELPAIKAVALPGLAAGLPEDLSYQLLARRPDLQAQNWYVQASLRQVDAARAAFYPDFNIKAFFGLDSIHLDKLFQRGSRQINLIPGLSLPIFDSGLLNANLQGKRAASDALIEQYNQSVLNTVRDIAVYGSRLAALNEQWRLQGEKIKTVQFNEQAARASLQQGLLSQSAAAETRLPVLAEEMALLLLEGQRLSQDIALLKALGGGYEASTDTPRSAAAPPETAATAAP